MVKSLSSYFFALSIGTSCMHAMEDPKLVNLRNGASWSPLHTAISVGNEGAVNALLDAGARVDSRALPSNRTPLMFSAEYNKNAIATLLLKKGAIIDQTDNDHMTALHIACKKGHVDLIETLVLAGASPAITPDFANTGAVYHAFGYKDYTDPSVLIALQKAMKKKSDTENASQEFALHRACQADTITGIEELVLKGARIDELDKSGNSAIHYAAANTNPEVVCTLLAAVKKKIDQEKNQLKVEAQAAAVPLLSASLPMVGNYPSGPSPLP